MKDYTHLRRGHFFTLAIGYTGVLVRVRILFVETRKRKVSSKVSSQQRPANPPINPQTNQPVKKQNFVGPRVGARIY
jgi:hypothetical protein